MLCIRDHGSMHAVIKHPNYSSVLCIRHHVCASCINMARYCSSTALRCALDISTVWCCVSIWLSTACTSCIINMAQMLCIVHQYDSMLCIHGSVLCIRHHYGKIIMAQCCAGINLWPNAVAICIMYQYAWLDAMRPWLKLCFMHQYGSMQHDIALNLPHHTLSTSVFATLFATWRRKKKRTKWCFSWLPLCYHCHCWGAMLAVSLARVALKKDREALQSA